MKHQQNLIKFFEERNIYLLLFNLSHGIHIHSFRMVNLLCCGDHFGNITFFDAKTIYRSPYLLDVSQPYLQNHMRTSLGRPQDVSEERPQDVGRTRPLEINIRPYGEVLITSTRDVFKTSVGNVPWRYIWDSMLTSSGRFIGTSSGRHISTS